MASGRPVSYTTTPWSARACLADGEVGGSVFVAGSLEHSQPVDLGLVAETLGDVDFEINVACNSRGGSDLGDQWLCESRIHASECLVGDRINLSSGQREGWNSHQGLGLASFGEQQNVAVLGLVIELNNVRINSSIGQAIAIAETDVLFSNERISPVESTTRGSSQVTTLPEAIQLDPTPFGTWPIFKSSSTQFETSIESWVDLSQKSGSNGVTSSSKALTSKAPVETIGFHRDGEMPPVLWTSWFVVVILDAQADVEFTSESWSHDIVQLEKDGCITLEQVGVPGHIFLCVRMGQVSVRLDGACSPNLNAVNIQMGKAVVLNSVNPGIQGDNDSIEGEVRLDVGCLERVAPTVAKSMVQNVLLENRHSESVNWEANLVDLGNGCWLWCWLRQLVRSNRRGFPWQVTAVARKEGVDQKVKTNSVQSTFPFACLLTFLRMIVLRLLL
ncbi:hypothetical protein OGAPHI_001789 [Ogataea philodendri]|uniref:Uncharacterized protein n=1 Tax=Ogataea philodendri TaxID=1378263 RepID=A0A9P8PAK7_9ASCO|nr:uncharacterized protein OGAPHI_001789 [Ogataea philodendri]KAH3668035.1 hypothetical protein OGAPHI_001789 [Ogataea philodendri]